MIRHVKKIMVRAAFKTFMDQLYTELTDGGFHVLGPITIRSEQNAPANYAVILAELPRLSSKMFTAAPNERVILPGCISVLELYPGEIQLAIANPTELLASASNNVQLFSLAREFRKVLEETVQKFESDKNWTPDLVTSWS